MNAIIIHIPTDNYGYSKYCLCNHLVLTMQIRHSVGNIFFSEETFRYCRKCHKELFIPLQLFSDRLN